MCVRREEEGGGEREGEGTERGGMEERGGGEREEMREGGRGREREGGGGMCGR